MAERLTGTIQLGAVFQAQYGGSQPTTDVGPWWKNGQDLYYFDYNTGQYQPLEDQMPIGGCILWGGPGAPDRYLLCQGQNVSRTQYQRLFQRIGAQWGAGDGANTFGLPPCGKYIVPAGYDGISGNTFYNGQTGGQPNIVINAVNLPELFVEGWTTPQGAYGAMVGAPVSSSQPGATIAANWPVISEDGLPVTQRKTPIPFTPPYQAMNLCIRYI